MNTAAAPLLALLLGSAPLAQEPSPAAGSPPLLGAGSHRYEWVAGWGRSADGEALGNTHGCIAVDGRGRILVNTDTERAVMVFRADGSLEHAWGKEFRGGLHGMTLVREDDGEFLYLAHTGRHEVIKTTLEGEVLWTMGPPLESGLYAAASQFKPTSVVVAPNGDLFVADGYGRSWIHQYTAERDYVRSFGGPGSEPGQLRTPHGMCIDSRSGTPRLLVCDRENHRLQLFDLDGGLVEVVGAELRRPCNACIRGDDVVVADLCGRVTILDAGFAVVTHQGDNPDRSQWANNGVPRSAWRDGVFLAPHAAAWDAAGDLYVMDWNAAGRVSKLRRLD